MNKFFNSLKNSPIVCLLIGSFLSCPVPGFCQGRPDSSFEKVTITLLKSVTAAEKVRDGQRQLYLFSFFNIDAELKHFYYQYRDSALGVVQGDTILDKGSKNKLLEGIRQAKPASYDLPFHHILDDIINKQGIASGSNVPLNNNEKENTSEDQKFNWIILSIISLIIISAGFYFFGKKKWKKIIYRGYANIENRPGDQEELTEGMMEMPNKEKPKKEYTKLKLRLKTSESEYKKLIEEYGRLKDNYEKLKDEKYKETLEKTEIEERRNKLIKEKEELNELLKSETTKKEDAISIAKEFEKKYHDLITEKQESDKANDITKQKIDRLQNSFLHDSRESFPDINKTVHSWFLLQEVTTGIRNNAFGVLSTPNFCKWILNEEHTFPELDTLNKAGNAHAIVFCRELKRKGVTQIAPNNDYLILNSQKITQRIFESL